MTKKRRNRVGNVERQMGVLLMPCSMYMPENGWKEMRDELVLFRCG
jgi:hypothetical protein